MRARRSAFAAFAALAAILFTQVAMAAAAWEKAPSPCHESTPTTNVCASHCANNDLTVDTPRIKVAAPPAVAAIAVVAPVRYPQVVAVRVAILPAGPPPRILFQSFLI